MWPGTAPAEGSHLPRNRGPRSHGRSVSRRGNAGVRLDRWTRPWREEGAEREKSFAVHRGVPRTSSFGKSAERDRDRCRAPPHDLSAAVLAQKSGELVLRELQRGRSEDAPEEVDERLDISPDDLPMERERRGRDVDRDLAAESVERIFDGGALEGPRILAGAFGL